MGTGRHQSMTPRFWCADGNLHYRYLPLASALRHVHSGNSSAWQRVSTIEQILTEFGWPMDCREFRAKHVAFVDDTLPLVDMEAMQRHLRVCSRCSRRDTAVRRSLLLVRNLPEIEPSADFMARLNSRLVETGKTRTTDRAFSPSLGAFATIAAGLALATYLALGMSGNRPSTIRLAPVIASLPEPMPSPINDPAFMASMSAGIPMWPTVLMMDQAPMHMANVELQQASLTR